MTTESGVVQQVVRWSTNSRKFNITREAHYMAPKTPLDAAKKLGIQDGCFFDTGFGMWMKDDLVHKSIIYKLNLSFQNQFFVYEISMHWQVGLSNRLGQLTIKICIPWVII